MHTSAEEVLIAHAVAVEIAPVLVTNPFVPIVAITTVVPSATSLTTGTAADMGSDSSSVIIRLPDIHLVTAGTVLHHDDDEFVELSTKMSLKKRTCPFPEFASLDEGAHPRTLA